MIPQCVGIIMDGNRRWARAKGLPQLEGHRAGLSALRRLVEHAHVKRIAHVAVYIFSTENWNREPAEVSYLMDLFRESIEKEMKELGKSGIRIRFAGQRDRFSGELVGAMERLERETELYTTTTLWCCLSYGGRAEIASAARVATEAGETISEESISKHLWTREMPDPDLIIRTGGEKRLSNFLPWQSIYSELFFVATLWPDFSEKEFDAMLAEYVERERRHGK